MPTKYITVWMDYVEKELLRRRVVKAKAMKGKNLSLVFLNTQEAKRLHKKYRRKNKATDVLSFSSIFEENLGELIFCSQVIQRQARKNRHSYRDELAYLTLHGLLHLLGFEHEKGGLEAERMYALQDDIYENYYENYMEGRKLIKN